MSILSKKSAEKLIRRMPGFLHRKDISRRANHRYDKYAHPKRRPRTKRGVPGISLNRVSICYGEDGGYSRDGIVEIRRGIDELTLPEAGYASVRIKLVRPYYINGMAVYTDDLPDGVDIRFFTRKIKGTPYNEIFNRLSDELDYRYFRDSAMVIKTAGGFREWAKRLPHEFLSKGMHHHEKAHHNKYGH